MYVIIATGFHSVVANSVPILHFATSGITSWQTALKCNAACHIRNNLYRQSAFKFKLMTVAIRGTIIFFLAICGTIIFFVAIRGLNTAVCHYLWCTFELGLSQQSEIQYQPVYNDSPTVRGATSFICATLQMQNLYAADCLGLNYPPMTLPFQSSFRIANSD
jgi:hypothetical protein